MQGGQMKTYREWRRLNRIWWGAGIFVLFLFLAGIGMNTYRIEMHDRMLFGILVENKIAEEQMQNIVSQLTEADAKWTNGKKRWRNVAKSIWSSPAMRRQEESSGMKI